MKHLSVAIDGRALVGNRTGIGVHTAEIAARLAVEPPPLIAAHAAISDRESIRHCRFAVDHAPFGLWWQLFSLPRVVEREDCEVLWGPHGTLPPRLKVPAVVSVHDLTSITAPHRHRLKTVASFNVMIRRSLDEARFIAAVSRTTADEVIRGFGIERSRITVVPNGVDPFFSPHSNAVRDYLLYVGTFEPRKGIGDLITAWEGLGERRPPLIITGDSGWREGRLRRSIARHVAAGAIELTGFVSRERLRELYRGALCLVYPSRDEGFGLPPLEAMACGTPVITSTGGAIPEIVGDAAVTFPPGDAEALRDAIRRLESDQNLRSEMIERGLIRAAVFSWQKSADLMLDLLSRAAGSP
jgi:glycosyltransferase involved in cell wall biosynthesis